LWWHWVAFSPSFYGAEEMGRSAARFDAKNCSKFAHNGFWEMEFAAKIQFGSHISRTSLELPITPAFHALRRCPSRAARRDRSEIRHRKLHYDFRFWKFGYVWNARLVGLPDSRGCCPSHWRLASRSHDFDIPSKVVPILRVAFALGRRRRIAPCPHSGLSR